MRKNRKFYFLISFTLLVLIFFICFSIAVGYIYYQHFKVIREKANTVLNLQEAVVSHLITQGNEEISMLRENTEHYWIQQPFTSYTYKQVMPFFFSFAKHYKQYDQVKLIDNHGKELFRIDNRDAHPNIIPKKHLQNKSHCIYFKKAMSLHNRRSAYFSNIKLSCEHKKIEEPFVPIIHIAMPVFSNDHKILGVILLNYKAENLLKQFRKIADYHIGQTLVLTEDGHFVIGFHPDEEWGHILKEKQDLTLKKLYPEVAKEIYILENKFFHHADGAYFIRDFRNIPNVDLKLLFISFVPNSIVIIPYFAFFVVGALLLLLVALSISWVWSLLKIRKERYELKLEKLARTDPLTKIPNRLELMKIARQEFARSVRSQMSFSIIIIDIDLFKQVNDQYGHVVGDKVLRHFSSLCCKHIRNIDTFARFGGEEFLIILPSSRLKNAITIANRIRQSCKDSNFLINADVNIKLTLSAGVATWEESDQAFSDMLTRADSELYKAKKQGRNAVFPEK